mgnify:CR=1 FL=1
MIKGHHIFLIAGGMIAVYLYATKGKDEEGFEEGFLAGWVTPAHTFCGKCPVPIFSFNKNGQDL